MNKTPMNHVPNLQNSVYCRFYVLIDFIKHPAEYKKIPLARETWPTQVAYNDSTSHHVHCDSHSGASIAKPHSQPHMGEISG